DVATARRQRLVMAAAAAFIVITGLAVGLGIAAQRATRNYDAARETVGGLIDQLATGMRSGEGMPLRTINTTLNSAQSLLNTLEKESSNDPRLIDIKASMYFEFAKVYQNSDLLDEALRYSRLSLDLRKGLAERSPSHASLWNFAMSLDQVGDFERRTAP